MSADVSAAPGPRVIIADDHPPFRLGVRVALVEAGFEVVGEVADGRSAVALALREQPDVCLLDVSMPGGGIEAAQRIADARLATAVVMLTVSLSLEDVLAALRAGAVGYLPKDMRPDRLPAALLGVLKGEAALPRTLVGSVLGRLREYNPPVDALRVGEVELSTRESETLTMLSKGMTTAEVGDDLGLSPVTVRRHISAAVAKLGAADRDEAIAAILQVSSGRFA